MAMLLVAMNVEGSDAFKVIVNIANPVSSMQKADVSRLFLKKTTRWPSGDLVEPVDLPEASVIRQAFSKEILGRPATSIVAFWNQQIFAGREVPPVTKLTESEVVALVRQNVHAISYVSPGAVTKEVKVVEIVDSK